MNEKFHWHYISVWSIVSEKSNLAQIGTVVSGKIQFEFLYVHNLGPRSTMTLTFNTHAHFFIYSIRCQLLLPFRSLAALNSKRRYKK